MKKNLLVTLLVVAAPAWAGKYAKPPVTTPPQEPPKLVVPQPQPVTPPKFAPNAHDTKSAPEATRPLAAPVQDFSWNSVDDSHLTELQKDILNSLKSGKEVDFTAVTDAWIELFLKEFNEKHHSQLSLTYIKGLLYRLAKSPQTPNDPFKFKAFYEWRLDKSVHKHPSVYNEANKNPLELLMMNKSQCASGSVCYSFLSRTAWGKDNYQAKKPVIIFMNGHVLPGFILTDENGVPHLVGVETTASGTARRDFGKLSELANRPEAFRIVDANDFALMQIFGDHSTQKKEMGQFLLSKSAEQHGYDLAKLEAKVAAEAKKAESSGTAGGANHEIATVLGFGDPTTPPGDKKREQLGENWNPPAPAPESGYKPMNGQVVTAEKSHFTGHWKKLEGERLHLSRRLKEKFRVNEKELAEELQHFDNMAIEHRYNEEDLSEIGFTKAELDSESKAALKEHLLHRLQLIRLMEVQGFHTFQILDFMRTGNDPEKASPVPSPYGMVEMAHTPKSQAIKSWWEMKLAEREYTKTVIDKEFVGKGGDWSQLLSNVDKLIRTKKNVKAEDLEEALRASYFGKALNAPALKRVEEHFRLRLRAYQGLKKVGMDDKAIDALIQDCSRGYLPAELSPYRYE